MSMPCIDCRRLAGGTRCAACRRAHERRRGAQRAAYDDERYRKARRALRAGVGQRCHICGQWGADTLDHVMPLVRGGNNDPSNLRPAHRRCNSGRRD